MKFPLLFLVIVFFHCSTIAAVNCSFSNPSPLALNFGNIDPYDSSQKTQNLSFSVTCQNAGDQKPRSRGYTISFSTGTSGNQLARAMFQTASIKENYNIYSNTSITPLGDGSGGSSTITEPTFFIPAHSSVTHTYNIQGRIPPQPLAVKGSYSDLITMTLTWKK